MAKESPAKIKCSAITQIAIAVEDLEQVAKNYWDILGIGPWAIYNWEAPLVYDRKYHGKTIECREKIALVQVGNVELELVQPLDGTSLYRDWLDEHGEGLHHLQFLVDDLAETSRILEGEGFTSLQSGKCGPRHATSAYNYFEIKPLRAIWEPVQMGSEPVGGGPVMYPSVTDGHSPKLKCSAITQIAIAVEDLEQVAKNYWDILGIGPWAIYNWEAPLVYDRKYHGKTIECREKIALVQVGNVELELVQPLDGTSLYRDWLDEHGEGLHHLQFLVDDLAETSRILEGEGFTSLQSGKCGPRHATSAYNYFEIKPLRAIWEPVQMGSEPVGGGPVMYP